MTPITIMIGVANEGQVQNWVKAIQASGWTDLEMMYADNVVDLRHRIAELIEQRAPFMVITLPYLAGGAQRRLVFPIALSDLFRADDEYCFSRPLIVMNAFNEVFDQTEIHYRQNVTVIEDAINDLGYIKLTQIVRQYLDEQLFFDYIQQGTDVTDMPSARRLYAQLLEVISVIKGRSLRPALSG